MGVLLSGPWVTEANGRPVIAGVSIRVSICYLQTCPRSSIAVRISQPVFLSWIKKIMGMYFRDIINTYLQHIYNDWGHRP